MFTSNRYYPVYFSTENINVSEKRKETLEFSTKSKAISLRFYMFYIEFPPKQTFFLLQVWISPSQNFVLKSFLITYFYVICTIIRWCHLDSLTNCLKTRWYSHFLVNFVLSCHSWLGFHTDILIPNSKLHIQDTWKISLTGSPTKCVLNCKDSSR